MSDLLLLPSPFPSQKKPFEVTVARLGLVYDFVFGSGASAGSGQTAITNNSELATWFDAYSQNAGTTVINREWQRYQPITDVENFVFAADALELTATLPNGSVTGTVTATVGADVTYNRIVTISDASTVKIGRVVGFGPAQYNNLHVTLTYSIVGTVTVGDTVTTTLTPKDNAWAPVVCVATVATGDTIATLAAAIVNQINSNPTLQANQITAYLLSDSQGAYGITYPRRGDNPEYPNSGLTAKGSLRWCSVAITATGTVTHNSRQQVCVTYVVAKTGTSITLNHPVTITAGTTITFSPTRFLVCTVNAGTAVIPVAAGMETGIGMGQAVQLSFQDPNLRRVTAVASGAITVNGTVYPRAGQFVVFYPCYEMVVNANYTGITLPSSLVPAGVEEGMYAGNLYSTTNGFVSGAPKVISKTSTSVTLDMPMTVGNNDTIIFYPAIDSAQIWSKFIAAPGMDSRTYIAGELTADFPDAADIGAWPAFWAYTATNDPNPTPGGSGASEVDFTDTFNYWNNLANNMFEPANSGGGGNLFVHPDFSTSANTLLGNNLGMTERKIQFTLTPSRVYYYLDGQLIRCCKFSWNTYKRAQFAANLAMGSASTSFNSSGFFPIDVSQFPMKFRIKRLRFWAAPNSGAPM